MASVVPYNLQGPDTYTANVLIPGAILVEPDAATGKVKPCTAGSVKCLGVALYSAAPSGAIQGTTTYGEVVIDMSTLQEELAVAWQGTYKLTATGAIAFGDPVICAANGTVAVAGATPDARTVIGKCVEPLGIAGGAVGLIRLNLG